MHAAVVENLPQIWPGGSKLCGCCWEIIIWATVLCPVSLGVHVSCSHETNQTSISIVGWSGIYVDWHSPNCTTVVYFEHENETRQSMQNNWLGWLWLYTNLWVGWSSLWLDHKALSLVKLVIWLTWLLEMFPVGHVLSTAICWRCVRVDVCHLRA